MIYPRLKLLDKLLSKDGCLVISIGYQEIFNLMPVIKELFSNKQIACITVQTSGGKPSGSFNYQHEYLIFIIPNNFEANPMLFTGGKSRTPFEGLTLATFDRKQRPNQAYPIFVNTENYNLFGVGESLQERIKNGSFLGDPLDFDYDFTEAPPGTVAIWPITSKGKECVWRLTPNRLVADWEKGFIKITPNRQKNSLNKFSIQYLPEGVIKKIDKGALEVNGNEPNAPTLSFGENTTVGSDIPTIWLEKDFFSVKGTTLLNNIFSTKMFDYPKPLELVKEILRALTSANDIVLDSFAGSGTTGHAALELNLEDGGNRKFILIEMEDYADRVTSERLKRIVLGYNSGEEKKEGISGSFDFYTIGAPLFVGENKEYLNEKVGIEKIRQYVWYSETKAAKIDYKAINENPYYLGSKDDTAYYFIYERDDTTSLDHEFLSTINIKAGQYVIYADNCLLANDFMSRHNIIFKKIPRDITRF